MNAIIYNSEINYTFEKPFSILCFIPYLILLGIKMLIILLQINKQLDNLSQKEMKILKNQDIQIKRNVEKLICWFTFLYYVYYLLFISALFAIFFDVTFFYISILIETLLKSFFSNVIFYSNNHFFEKFDSKKMCWIKNPHKKRCAKILCFVEVCYIYVVFILIDIIEELFDSYIVTGVFLIVLTKAISFLWLKMKLNLFEVKFIDIIKNNPDLDKFIDLSNRYKFDLNNVYLTDGVLKNFDMYDFNFWFEKPIWLNESFNGNWLIDIFTTKNLTKEQRKRNYSFIKTKIHRDLNVREKNRNFFLLFLDMLCLFGFLLVAYLLQLHFYFIKIEGILATVYFLLSPFFLLINTIKYYYMKQNELKKDNALYSDRTHATVMIEMLKYDCEKSFTSLYDNKIYAAILKKRSNVLDRIDALEKKN